MKRTFATHIQQSLAVMCLVLGAFLFSATSVSAQSGVGSGSDLNWKASDAAKLVLEQAIQDLHNDSQVTVVGSQSYNQVHYFKSIYADISLGSSTYQASVDGLGIFSDTSSGATTRENTTGVVLNSSQKQVLFQVAVGLLTN